MILLLPALWLLLWLAISVLICAALGLTPMAALRIGSILFLLGGIVLPLAAWLTRRAMHRRR